MPGDGAGNSSSAAQTASSVEYRDVTKRYPGQAEPAIESLSLEVPAGEICVLVGRSGCGKTTALRLANRMIEMSGGDILLDGESIRRRPAAELRRGIGYVIQQIGLFPHLTIGENIAVVPKLLGWDRQRIASRLEELSSWFRSLPTCATATRRSSRAASVSASGWRGHSRQTLP